MELISYIGSVVHIELNNGFFYVGKVIEADENSITLHDRKGIRVSVAKTSISSIKEVL